jgi:hypothetical protein
MGALIGAGASLLGGALAGDSAEDAAYAQAAGQRDAARMAAEESRFRPVGITTRFGSSNFQYGPDGRVSGAGYTLDPQLRAYQDRFLGLAGGGLTQAEQAQQQFAPLQGAAQGLFGLGQQYLAQSPEQAAQQYMAAQQNLLAPSREREFAQLQNRLFNTGRSGLSVGATSARPSGAAGLGATTPEMEAYYNAIAQQDAALAAQAQQAGQQQTAFGAGLFGTGGELLRSGYQGQTAALGPYEAYLRGATGLESLGQSALDIGAQLGGRMANPTGAQALLQGGMAAAGSQAAADAYNPFATALIGASRSPALMQGAANLFSPFGGTAQGAYGQQGQYLAGALSNPQTQQAQMLAAQQFGF